jgi:acyl carrier protein
MIENAIRQFIIDELRPPGAVAELTDDYPLLDRGTLDSLGLFHLVAFLEDEFGVAVEDEELVPQNFGTIHDIAMLVETKRS